MGLDCLQRFPALKAKCLCFDVISPQDGHMVNDPKSLMRGFSVTSSSRNERPPAAQSHSKTSEESVKHGSHDTAQIAKRIAASQPRPCRTKPSGICESKGCAGLSDRPPGHRLWLDPSSNK